MKIIKNKLYCLVNSEDHPYDNGKSHVLTGEELSKWLLDSSTQEGDKVYELGKCWEIYSEKKIKLAE